MMEALRKRALYGLRACVPKTEEDEKIGCADCPYGCSKADAVRLPAQMIEDIRAVLENMELVNPNLLKRDAPRVLTLEEVIISKPGTVVWLEDIDKPDVISGLFKRLFIYTKVIDFLIVKEEVNNEVTADLDVYGSKWRCWTSRPTDEQREAVKWE